MPAFNDTHGRPVSTSTTVTDREACPYCGTTTGVQPITGTSPKVAAWRCTECATDWAITTVNPQRTLIASPYR
jgi:transposase-like protein